MARSIVYIVPGIQASKLVVLPRAGDSQFKGVTEVWWNLELLAEEGFIWLTLPSLFNIRAQGQFPQPDSLHRKLFELAPKNDWTVSRHHWDWRRDIGGEAFLFAERIKLDAARNPGGCYIVAHSMGGLLARATWKHLGADADRLINRIVTLGTPHRGSYAPPGVLSLSDPRAVAAIGALNSIYWSHRLLPPVPPTLAAHLFAPMHHVRDSLLLAYWSWPGFGMLFPWPELSAELGDDNAPLIFDPNEWQDSPVEINPQQLKELTGWIAWISDPSASIPFHKLRVVAGTGRSTYTSTKRRSDQPAFPLPGNFTPAFTRDLVIPSMRMLGFSTTLQGDGEVPLASALLPGYTATILDGCSHGGLWDHPEVLAKIEQWLLEPLTDPTNPGKDQVTGLWPPPPAYPTPSDGGGPASGGGGPLKFPQGTQKQKGCHCCPS